MKRPQKLLEYHQTYQLCVTRVPKEEKRKKKKGTKRIFEEIMAEISQI